MRKMIMGAVALVLVLVAGGASAEERALSGAEIRELLNGKVAVGLWDGAEYEQSFYEDGVTIYAAKGQDPSKGQWRVNEETAQLETEWGNGQWAGYGVSAVDGTYVWTSEGEPQSFEVVDARP